MSSSSSPCSPLQKRRKLEFSSDSSESDLGFFDTAECSTYYSSGVLSLSDFSPDYDSPLPFEDGFSEPELPDTDTEEEELRSLSHKISAHHSGEVDEEDEPGAVVDDAGDWKVWPEEGPDFESPDSGLLLHDDGYDGGTSGSED
ncbi:hypothetical protein ACP70R_001510 [Stipagrostis hirtigluma subsp. patula]